MFRSRKSREKRRERPKPIDGTILAMDNVYKSQVAEDIKLIVLNYLEGEGKYKLLAKLEEEEKYICISSDGVTYESLVEHGVDRERSSKGFALVSRARHIHSHLGTIDDILDKISLRVKEKIKTARQPFH
ncbi:hypothetical protein SCHPADRAFT_892973 [Schizopora paradoxa]|uniref:Uncharacterized protein n=1 Tax=Schizopora paradoxa TaxID=27342 RepID=A0A0H2RJM0_9AGAM|nr:hypothetical protein SCHPADRAFT_892973 [Schizopora paradoxa]